MVCVAAATTGCGASVTEFTTDAGTDVGTSVDTGSVVETGTAVDVGTPRDVVAPTDVPSTNDVSAPVDGGACAAMHVVNNPGSICSSETVSFPCGVPSELLAAGDAGGAIDTAVCQRNCSIGGDAGGVPYCYVAPNGAGGSQLHCQIPCPGGRRPEGFADAAGGCDAGVGGWFARLASLEAASVFAFERMERELGRFGAPTALLEEVRRAVADERKHTTMTVALAGRFGAAPVLPAGFPMAPRDLAAVALENAVEGCVRETFGALVATWQATHARDARVAAAMAVIAEDETRHAALSWSLHAWADERLDAGTRRSVRVAMEGALASLRDDLAPTVGEDLCRVAGMPSPAEQRALLAQLHASVLGWCAEA